MEIVIKYNILCNVIWDIKCSSEKLQNLIFTIDTIYGIRLNNNATAKITNFFKVYKKRMDDCKNSKQKFLKKYEDWLKLELSIEIDKKVCGRPNKEYDDVNDKTKKKKRDEIINTYSTSLIRDSFKSSLLKSHPKDAGRIVDALPTASPKRLKRMVESIPTPKSTTDFTEEDSLALVLNLGLSRNKYEILRKTLIEKLAAFCYLRKYCKLQEPQFCPPKYMLMILVQELISHIFLKILLQGLYQNFL